jgi:hypothetical protein
MKNEFYNIRLEIRNKDGKLFEHPRAGMFTGFKFFNKFNSEDHMEHYFRSTYEELKMLMPENKFNFDASVFNSISGTWMCMYSFYGEEGRFVVHT